MIDYVLYHRHMIDTQAMVETGAPLKWKNDGDCPFFYLSNSWRSQQQIPWNDEGKRPMRPDEWINLQDQTIQDLKVEIQNMKQNWIKPES